MEKKYDIFISYRRKWGALYARILQLKLQEKGYKVFLDYDELKDGHFDEKIKNAIKNSSLFIFMYSKDSLQRCANEDDWVRQEIECAISHGKHIIPVVPDREISDDSDDIPQEILQAIGRNQHSDVDYGKALDASVNELIKDRIVPHIGKRSPVVKKVVKAMVAAVLLFFAAFFLRAYLVQKSDFNSCSNYDSLLTFVAEYDRFPSFFRQQANVELSRYDSLMITECHGYPVNITGSITYRQLLACNSIMKHLVEVPGGTFLMGADAADTEADDELERPQLQQTVYDFMIGIYEVSVGEWCGIMNRPYEPEEEYLPMTGINWLECQAFVDTLYNLTGIAFSIPTEAEWEYAARGGNHPDCTKYSGSDDVKKSAVYEKNSGGHPSILNYAPNYRDMRDLTSNSLGLYDMSGNVEEWCRDDFRLYSDISQKRLDPEIINDQAKVIRGGSYLSTAHDVRITTRGPKDMRDKSSTVGLRLVVEL